MEHERDSETNCNRCARYSRLKGLINELKTWK